nr:MAG TPA: Reverse gyrase zinc finger [Caudoviricetes sp.]
MTSTKHDMYLLVRKAICPVCSGLIKSLVEGQIYK